MTAPAEGKALRRVWRRQFLLQGCWNFDGMQNVGFAYALLPALRERYAGRPEDLLRAVKRHAEFFNTNPVLAGLVLGATARLEERAAAGEADPRGIGAFKVGMMGSLGAIGDAYFWGALKPMASAVGAVLAFIHPLLGIAALLALYNASHIVLRRRAFAAGTGGEASALDFLKEAGFARRTEERKMIAAIVAGAFAGGAASRIAVAYGAFGAAPGILLVAAAAVYLFTVLYRKAVSPSETMSVLLVIGILMLWQ